jgi:hypothetical protein
MSSIYCPGAGDRAQNLFFLAETDIAWGDVAKSGAFDGVAAEMSPNMATPEGLMVRPQMPEAPTPRPLIPGTGKTSADE